MGSKLRLCALRFQACLVAGLLALPLPNAAAVFPAEKAKPDPVLKGLPVTELSADEAILHALNRIAYGPRPGEVQRVRQMGLARWIDEQLNPSGIDDRGLDARLSNLPTLRMKTAELIRNYPQAKQAAKQAGVSREPAKQPPAAMETAASARDPQPGSEGSAAAPDGGDPPSPMKQASLNLPTQGLGPRQAASLDPNAMPRAIADDSRRPQRVIEELAMAKVARAVYSERQLQQVMDDFWFNHFNVYAAKGEDRYYLTSYERDVIGPHALGKFRDLVTGSAKSPAMLFYLDNFLSADPRAAERRAEARAARRMWGRPRRPAPGNPPPAKKKQQRGLNENYGRELMELHTLGVDGGYTQKDVTEVARCFTGWTIEKPRENPQFLFDERLHDPDKKTVLGKTIHAGGIKDGQRVIDLLVRHPSTAKFISTKIARRFVADTPPPALVARMAGTFRSTDGDIRAVLRVMIYSPEFWTREAYRAKVKTPFEYVVSTARALGTDVDTPMPLVQWIARIGEPLYQCQPPTGYPDKAEAWVNAGALLNRLNFSLALAGNRVRGSRTDAAALLGVSSATDGNEVLGRALEVFLAGQAAPSTVEILEKQLADPQLLQAKFDDPVRQIDLGMVTGLVLGAPEFQRR